MYDVDVDVLSMIINFTFHPTSTKIYSLFTLYFSTAKLQLKEDTFQHCGLVSQLSLVCSRCRHSTPLPTSRQRTKKGQSYDVNRRAAYAMGEIGGSRAMMVDFCSIFNMPAPPNPSSWSHHNISTCIYSALVDELM